MRLNMDDNNFLGNLYNDFFNSNINKKNNDKINDELSNFTSELKKINDNSESISEIVSRKKEEENNLKNNEKQKEDKLNELFERIENLYLTDESKETLKKMMSYAKNYENNEIKNYINFDLRLYSDSREITRDVVEIIADGLSYFNYIQGNKIYETSFFQASEEDLIKIYKSNYNVLVFKDIDGISGQKELIREGILTIWEDKLLNEGNRKITIVVDKNEEKVNNGFSNHIVMRDRIFDFKLQTIKPESQDIYQELLEKLKKDYDVDEDFEVSLLDYIVATYPKTDMTYSEYRDSIYEKILFNKTKENITKDTIPSYEKDKSIDEIFYELNELVGLKNVKEMLNELVNLMRFKEKVGTDVKLKDTNLHMIFLGNPGTGKTTVARMVSEILYNLKYIKQNKFMEVSVKDLVGEYVGQTAPKTMKVIEKALGGVLFIDEAYTLASKPGRNNSFNEECVATLIQAMENYRDNLVVILAGYTKEMNDFLNSNSGIASRIGYIMEFNDYTVDELILIFKSMIEKAGFFIEKDAIEKAIKIIEEYKGTPNFGNARFVRNLYEKTIIKHASNCKNKKSKKQIRTIIAEDISVENLLKM